MPPSDPSAPDPFSDTPRDPERDRLSGRVRRFAQVGAGLAGAGAQLSANSLFGGQGNGLTFILYGGIIILLSRFEPGGLLEIWNHHLARKGRKGRTE